MQLTKEYIDKIDPNRVYVWDDEHHLNFETPTAFNKIVERIDIPKWVRFWILSNLIEDKHLSLDTKTSTVSIMQKLFMYGLRIAETICTIDPEKYKRYITECTGLFFQCGVRRDHWKWVREMVHTITICLQCVPAYNLLDWENMYLDTIDKAIKY